jgi:hypothetical protein
MSAFDRGAIRRVYFKSRALRVPINAVRYTGIDPNDLFVASYPRSGTTWLRFLLFELLTNTPAEFVPVNRAIPYVGKHRDAPRLLPSGGRIIQTHETFLRGVASAIYLVRDPRSVVLSEYRWQLRTGLFEGTFDAFFDAFLSGRANPYGRWDRHVETWLRSDVGTAGRIHVVRYVDLRTDPQAELQRILRFLGIHRPPSSVKTVIANNSLAAMQAKEERAPEGALGARARGDIRFVQSGSTSAWKDDLSDEQARAIEETFAVTLRRLRDRRPQSLVPGAADEDTALVTPTSLPAASNTNEGGLKVIYIAGWGRSGSTLLDTLLGQIDGFFSTGELRYIWERGVIGEWTCGCQRSVKTCPLWSAVLADLTEGGTADAATIVEWQRRATRFRHTPSVLAQTPADLDDVPLRSYIDVRRRLFLAIRRATSARVIVDSSKLPADAAALALAPDLELYVVHLVRDPRAVAYSWRRKQAGIDRHGVIDSTGSWLAWNLMTDRVRSRLPQRSMLLRYEDFAADPSAVLMRIVELVGEEPSSVPESRGGIFDVRETHTVSGNPRRFRSGPIEVLSDDEWRARLAPGDKATATILALPRLRRYGYPVFVDRGDTSERRAEPWAPTE